MIRRALMPGAVALVAAFALGWLIAGADAAASAALGIAVVLANFAANGWSLAWASRISIPMVQAVALGGFVVRMGVILGLLFALDRVAWFSPLSFGLAVVPGTVALLVFETRLMLRGMGVGLEIPADPAAAQAAEALASREV